METWVKPQWFKKQIVLFLLHGAVSSPFCLEPLCLVLKVGAEIV